MIALAMVAMGAGMTINFVVVAPLAREIEGMNEMMVAGILTLSAAIYALMIPFWGRLADRFGRKRVMVFSLWAMGLTNMVFLFVLETALAGMLTGVVAFMTLAFTRIWFGLLSPGLQPASSIIGPAGASVLAPFGALVPLWGSIIFNLITGLILLIVLPKPRAELRTTDAKRPKPLAMRDPRVFPHLAFLFSYFVAVGMIQQTLGWFMKDRYQFVDTVRRTAEEAAVFHTGVAFACIALSMVVVQFGYVAPRKPDPKKMLPIGLALVATGYICADLFYPFWAMCISFLVVGIGAALAVPAANALGSLSVERHEQGGAAALLSAAPPAGFIFGPLIGAMFYQLSPILPFAISAAAVVSLSVYALLVTAKRPLAPAE